MFACTSPHRSAVKHGLPSMVFTKALVRRPNLVAILVSCLASLPGQGALAQGQKVELAQPQDIALETADHVQIVATFYEGAKSKETVPVILLHDEKSTRRDMDRLAKFL